MNLLTDPVSKNEINSLQERTLSKLEWWELTEILSSFAKLDESKSKIRQLRPGLSRAEVQKSWQETSELRLLLQKGLSPPVSLLPQLAGLLSAIQKGQLLSSEELKNLFDFLKTVVEIRRFCQQMSKPLVVLNDFFHRTFDQSPLIASYQKLFDEEGRVKDSASPEMARVRQDKKHLRLAVEKSLTQLMEKEEIAKYLQDRFWTVRSSRYVLPAYRCECALTWRGGRYLGIRANSLL